MVSWMLAMRQDCLILLSAGFWAGAGAYEGVEVRAAVVEGAVLPDDSDLVRGCNTMQLADVNAVQIDGIGGRGVHTLIRDETADLPAPKNLTSPHNPLLWIVRLVLMRIWSSGRAGYAVETFSKTTLKSSLAPDLGCSGSELAISFCFPMNEGPAVASKILRVYCKGFRSCHLTLRCFGLFHSSFGFYADV